MPWQTQRSAMDNSRNAKSYCNSDLLGDDSVGRLVGLIGTLPSHAGPDAKSSRALPSWDAATTQLAFSRFERTSFQEITVLCVPFASELAARPAVARGHLATV